MSVVCLDKISKLSGDIISIQKSSEETNKKVEEIYTKLDSDVISGEDLSSYRSEVLEELPNSQHLEPESITFLAASRYIKVKLGEAGSEDYSMYILQLSRVIENELLRKVFTTYYAPLSEMKEEDREAMLESEFTNSKSGIFSRMLYKEKTTFTLGIMQKILASTYNENGNSLSESALFQSFRSHMLTVIDEGFLVKSMVKNLDVICTDYRNKAAHVEIISEPETQKFTELVDDVIGLFLESLKMKTV